MSLWGIITSNSTLTINPSNSFWDHLNNQSGGGLPFPVPVLEEITIEVHELKIEVVAPSEIFIDVEIDD